VTAGSNPVGLLTFLCVTGVLCCPLQVETLQLADPQTSGLTEHQKERPQLPTTAENSVCACGQIRF